MVLVLTAILLLVIVTTLALGLSSLFAIPDPRNGVDHTRATLR